MKSSKQYQVDPLSYELSRFVIQLSILYLIYAIKVAGGDLGREAENESQS